MILSLITYPLSPKIKPRCQVYANVSKLPPPPLVNSTETNFKIEKKCKKNSIYLHTYLFGSSKGIVSRSAFKKK